MMAWAMIPVGFGHAFVDLNVGILYIFAMSSLNVYGIIIAGWASNSKYAFLGALRSAAQMISYEVSIGLIIMSILISSGSMNLYEIVMSQEKLWYIIPHFPMFVIFLISALAETNRTPFDLPEAEAELAGGYNVEYSSFPFALFMLGEYANVILMSSLTSILFLGGWHPILGFGGLLHPFIWFVLKTSAIVFIFIWVRATLPRYRYDQLMRIGWKVFLPMSLVWVILTAFVSLYFKLVPVHV
jgi:NADH-quinone oxidoreductase subunit H